MPCFQIRNGKRVWAVKFAGIINEELRRFLEGADWHEDDKGRIVINTNDGPRVAEIGCYLSRTPLGIVPISGEAFEAQCDLVSEDQP